MHSLGHPHTHSSSPPAIGSESGEVGATLTRHMHDTFRPNKRHQASVLSVRCALTTGYVLSNAAHVSLMLEPRVAPQREALIRVLGVLRDGGHR